MVNFRKAESTDTKILRRIAHDSEAYWGYDGSFMKIFNDRFNLTEHFILNYPVFIGVKESILCFWGAIPEGSVCELEYFYVSPEQIGSGLGKTMWNHFVSWCKERGIRKITFVTSPQAVGFYERMGAVRDGERPSLIDGRPVPQLAYICQ